MGNRDGHQIDKWRMEKNETWRIERKGAGKQRETEMDKEWMWNMENEENTEMEKRAKWRQKKVRNEMKNGKRRSKTKKENNRRAPRPA